MLYSVTSLENMCDAIGESAVKKIISNFDCKLNKNIEYFLKEKAIPFIKFGIAKTFIVSTTFNDKEIIVGYFSLAYKITKINKEILSYSYKRKMQRFAIEYDTNYFMIPLPLIGQLGKNFYNGYNEFITGDELLELTCNKVREVQKLVGGKFVFLECENILKLKNFYEKNGFIYFGIRNLENVELEKVNSKCLLQMLCDLN